MKIQLQIQIHIQIQIKTENSAFSSFRYRPIAVSSKKMFLLYGHWAVTNVILRTIQFALTPIEPSPQCLMLPFSNMSQYYGGDIIWDWNRHNLKCALVWDWDSCYVVESETEIAASTISQISQFRFFFHCNILNFVVLEYVYLM